MAAVSGTPARATDGCIVSVVVPTYNGERFLADTLRAVLAQTQPQVELIVVDDGSSDGSMAVAATVAPDALRLQQRNGGVSAARNHGLARARGRYVIFLDQDDIWHPRMLERQVAWLDAHPDIGAVVCRYHHWWPAGGAYPVPESIWGDEPPVDVDPAFSGHVFHQFLVDCWALTSGTMLRHEVVSAAGGFDLGLPYSEDWDLWLRLSRQTQFALLNWPPVLYRHHQVQGSAKMRQRDFRVELLLRHAEQHGLSSDDGRSLTRAQFAEVVAKYQAEFGYDHLDHGNRWIGVRALLAAWARQPRQLRRLALALAGSAGWRPRR